MAETIDLEGLINDSIAGETLQIFEDPPILTVPETIRFATRGVQPPGALYVTLEDTIVVTVYNSVSSLQLSLQGRLLRADGSVRHFRRDFSPSSDRVQSTFAMGLAEGFLLAVGVTRRNGTPKFGQTYVNIALIRGLDEDVDRYQSLTSGYIEAANEVWYPTNPPHPFVYGMGNLRTIVGTDPAAGVEISEVVPTNARWRLLSFSALLTCSVAVAARQVRIVIVNSGQGFWDYEAPLQLTAGQVNRYQLGYGLGFEQSTTSTNRTVAGLPHLDLPEGASIITAVNNLQTGDNWSAPTMTVLEWIER